MCFLQRLCRSLIYVLLCLCLWVCVFVCLCVCVCCRSAEFRLAFGRDCAGLLYIYFVMFVCVCLCLFLRVCVCACGVCVRVCEQRGLYIKRPMWIDMCFLPRLCRSLIYVLLCLWSCVCVCLFVCVCVWPVYTKNTLKISLPTFGLQLCWGHMSLLC